MSLRIECLWPESVTALVTTAKLTSWDKYQNPCHNTHFPCSTYHQLYKPKLTRWANGNPSRSSTSRFAMQFPKKPSIWSGDLLTWDSLCSDISLQRNKTDRNQLLRAETFKLAFCTTFGVSRVMVCGVHLCLLCAVRYTTAFAMNAALMASEWKHRAWTVALNPSHQREAG